MDCSKREAILNSIKEKYQKYSHTPADCFRYSTGKPGLEALGYDGGLLENLPGNILNYFCGVGNPFSLGPINPGERVLDIGCGAGVDLLIASQLVKPEGMVFGVDLTPEMVQLARRNIKEVAVQNAEVTEGASEGLPYKDKSFNVVISNGVINLSLEKKKTFQEIFRVLKPGGRLQFADIIVESSISQETLQGVDNWSD